MPRRTKRSYTSWQAARAAAEARAGGWCEVGIREVCGRRGHHAHHVRMRSQGGADDVANLLWCCFGCHEYIHRHPAESYENGWLSRGG